MPQRGLPLGPPPGSGRASQRLPRARRRGPGGRKFPVPGGAAAVAPADAAAAVGGGHAAAAGGRLSGARRARRQACMASPVGHATAWLPVWGPPRCPLAAAALYGRTNYAYDRVATTCLSVVRSCWQARMRTWPALMERASADGKLTCAAGCAAAGPVRRPVDRAGARAGAAGEGGAPHRLLRALPLPAGGAALPARCLSERLRSKCLSAQGCVCQAGT
jgi:hypothetical protein